MAIKRIEQQRSDTPGTRRDTSTSATGTARSNNSSTTLEDDATRQDWLWFLDLVTDADRMARTAIVAIGAEAWPGGYLEKCLLFEVGLAQAGSGALGERYRHIRVRDNEESFFKEPIPARFAFGTEEWVRTAAELGGQLTTVFSALEQQQYDTIILAGHSVRRRLYYISSGTGWKPPSTVKVVDTQQFVQHAFPSAQLAGPSLEKSLEVLGLFQGQRIFYNAGNNAIYTLRILQHLAKHATEFARGSISPGMRLVHTCPPLFNR
jgi:hypothetical protein